MCCCLVTKGLPLYRYDIIQPSKAWDVNFKSPIYCSEDNSPKNEIGAFFFYDNEKETIAVAKNVVNQKRDFISSFNPNLSIWMTKTVLEKDFQMLDLSECQDIVELYVTLWNEEINIFREDFYKYDALFPPRPMKIILDDIRYIASHNENKLNKSDRLNESKCKILNFFSSFGDNEKLHYAGQLLTDFSNGRIFRELLEQKELDGYIFRETDAKTYCFFRADKLSTPETYIYSEN